MSPRIASELLPLPLGDALSALRPDTPGIGGIVGSQSGTTMGRQTGIDWAEVVTLRRAASERINENTQHWATENGVAMPETDRRMMGRSVIRRVVREHAQRLSTSGRELWDLALEQAYAAATEDAIFGYGRMQPLFDIPDAENIEIHGFDCVVIQYGDGRRVPHAPVADSDEELVEAIRFLGATANPPRAFDDAHPTMTLALGDRFRLHAMGFGIADRPSVVIRQHLLTDVDLSTLSRGGLMPIEVARFLGACVRAHRSMVISGDQVNYEVASLGDSLLG